ncbi:hypothetical protein DTO164E3_2534 [Paecilomyces variotii]|nr:hypothetical protein DTO164E3_2534 [Paecilomyces variotii]
MNVAWAQVSQRSHLGFLTLICLLREERLTYGHIFEAVEKIMQPLSLEKDSSLCHRASRRRLLMHGIPRGLLIF